MSGIVTLLFSSILGDKVGLMVRKKKRLRKNLIEEFNRNEKLKKELMDELQKKKELQTKVNQDLEARVLERTQVLEEANRKILSFAQEVDKLNSELDKYNYVLKKKIKEEKLLRIFHHEEICAK